MQKPKAAFVSALLIFFLTTLAGYVVDGMYAAALPGSNSSSEIEQALRTQQVAWNRRDIEGFMAGYWNSPQLTFFSGAKENQGWQASLDRYRATYTGPGHEMGKLDFSELRIEMLGTDAAFVRGTWRLTMADGKTPHGLFTLVFRKFPDGGGLCTTTRRRQNRLRFSNFRNRPNLPGIPASPLNQAKPL